MKRSAKIAVACCVAFGIASIFLMGCTLISKAPELRACRADRAKAEQEIRVCEGNLADYNQGLEYCKDLLNARVKGTLR